MYDYISNNKGNSMSKYTSSQKLWRIIKEPQGYYYEIRLAGMVIDRIKIEYPALGTLKEEGIINGRNE